MKAGVLLSGCGLGDGSQIEEVMLVYLALDKYGIDYVSFAPNKLQYDVINHLTEEEQHEERNILVESARIGRGKIKDLKNITAENLDALILPGGLGVFKNLSNYIVKNDAFSVDDDVERLIKDFYKYKKPILGICGSIILISKCLYNVARNLKIATEGNAFVRLLSKLNVETINCPADDIVVDKANKIITTPAFLSSQNMNEIYSGIDKMVRKLTEVW